VSEHQVSLREAISLFDAAAADPAVPLLEHMRNKEVAHSGTVWGQGPTEDRASFHYWPHNTKIWERLAWGAGINGLFIETQIEKLRRGVLVEVGGSSSDLNFNPEQNQWFARGKPA
jgi:hypothetical protein